VIFITYLYRQQYSCCGLFKCMSIISNLVVNFNILTKQKCLLLVTCISSPIVAGSDWSHYMAPYGRKVHSFSLSWLSWLGVPSIRQRCLAQVATEFTVLLRKVAGNLLCIGVVP
jgi:hypothetical protein